MFVPARLPRTIPLVLPTILLALLLLLPRPAAAGEALLDDDPATPHRISADGPVAFAIEVSVRRFDAGDAEGAVVASAADFADALAATGLAQDGPLLLSGRSPDQAVLDELRRSVAEGSTVHLAGGPAVLDERWDDELQRLGFSVRRLQGATRYETAAAVAGALIERTDDPTLYLATGTGWADSVSLGAWTAATGQPILLTGPDALHPAAARLISEADDPDVVLIGGTAAVGEAVAEQAREVGATVSRVAGPTRDATAAAIATEVWTQPTVDTFTLTNLYDDGAWRYGLAISGLAGDLRAPLLAVHPFADLPSTRDLVCSGPAELILAGGEPLVPEVSARATQDCTPAAPRSPGGLDRPVLVGGYGDDFTQAVAIQEPDGERWAERYEPEGDDFGVYPLGVSSGGRYAATAQVFYVADRLYTNLQVRDASDGRVLTRVAERPGAPTVVDLAWHPHDERLAAVVTSDGHLGVRDLPSGSAGDVRAVGQVFPAGEHLSLLSDVLAFADDGALFFVTPADPQAPGPMGALHEVPPGSTTVRQISVTDVVTLGLVAPHPSDGTLAVRACGPAVDGTCGVLRIDRLGNVLAQIPRADRPVGWTPDGTTLVAIDREDAIIAHAPTSQTTRTIGFVAGAEAEHGSISPSGEQVAWIAATIGEEGYAVSQQLAVTAISGGTTLLSLTDDHVYDATYVPDPAAASPGTAGANPDIEAARALPLQRPGYFDACTPAPASPLVPEGSSCLSVLEIDLEPDGQLDRVLVFRTGGEQPDRVVVAVPAVGATTTTSLGVVRYPGFEGQSVQGLANLDGVGAAELMVGTDNGNTGFVTGTMHRWSPGGFIPVTDSTGRGVFTQDHHGYNAGSGMRCLTGSQAGAPAVRYHFYSGDQTSWQVQTTTWTWAGGQLVEGSTSVQDFQTQGEAPGVDSRSAQFAGIEGCG